MGEMRCKNCSSPVDTAAIGGPGAARTSSLPGGITNTLRTLLDPLRPSLLTAQSPPSFRRMSTIRILFLLLLLLPAKSQAIDLKESFQLHGFISQGYLDSTANNFMDEESRTGTFAFTDMAINANLALSDHFRAGAQIYIRNFGDYSEDDIQLDWALIDYHLHDALGIRLGKVKLPMGLYNETRDSDFLRNMIFLPQSVYDDTRRDLYLSYVGGGLHGNVQLNGWGDFDYHLFAGETCFPEESVLAESNKRNIIARIDRNNSAITPNPAIPPAYVSSDRESNELFGGSLVFNHTNDHLRLGATWMHAHNQVFVNGASSPALESEIHHKYVLSLEYSWLDWILSGEYGETHRTQTMYGQTTIDGPSQGWYVMLSYSPFAKWTLSALYDEFYRLKNDKDGSTLTTSYSGWRKDIGLGIRYDMNDSWNAKFEYHWLDGAAMQLNVFNPEGLARYWNYCAAKVSFSF